MWHSPQGTCRLVGDRKCTDGKTQRVLEKRWVCTGDPLREASYGGSLAHLFQGRCRNAEVRKVSKRRFWSHCLPDPLDHLLLLWAPPWPMALALCAMGGQVTLNFTFIHRCHHPVHKGPIPMPFFITTLTWPYIFIVCLSWWNMKSMRIEFYLFCSWLPPQSLGQCWLRETSYIIKG